MVNYNVNDGFIWIYEWSIMMDNPVYRNETWWFIYHKPQSVTTQNCQYSYILQGPSPVVVETLNNGALNTFRSPAEWCLVAAPLCPKIIQWDKSNYSKFLGYLW